MNAPYAKRHDRAAVDRRCKEVASAHFMRPMAVIEHFVTGAVDVHCVDNVGCHHVLRVIAAGEF